MNEDNGFKKTLLLGRVQKRMEELAEDGDVVTYKELAAMSGVATATVSYYFKGETSMPVSFLFWLAIRLGVSADWLIGLSDEK